jgi:hypothetical protein
MLYTLCREIPTSAFKIGFAHNDNQARKYVESENSFDLQDKVSCRHRYYAGRQTVYCDHTYECVICNI